MDDPDDDGHLHLIGIEEGEVVTGKAPDLRTREREIVKPKPHSKLDASGI